MPARNVTKLPGMVSVLGVLVTTNVLLAGALIRQKAVTAAVRSSSRACGRQLTQRDAVVRVVRAEAAAFRRAIMRQPLTGAVLSGTDVRTGRRIAVSQEPDGIYYLMDTTCPACAANVAPLNRLVEQHGVRVIGLSYDESDAVRRFSERQGVRFPVLVKPDGRLPSLLPGAIAPVTMAVVGGKMESLVLGRLSADMLDHLAALSPGGSAKTRR
jgi:hypothetical protein